MESGLPGLKYRTGPRWLLNPAVRSQFSPLRSCTIVDPFQVNKLGTTKPTPLPDLVGANARMCSFPSWVRYLPTFLFNMPRCVMYLPIIAPLFVSKPIFSSSLSRAHRDEPWTLSILWVFRMAMGIAIPIGISIIRRLRLKLLVRTSLMAWLFWKRNIHCNMACGG